MTGVVRAAIAFGVLWPSRAAWALCPNCLAERPALTPTLELLGLFLLLPFAVAGIAIWIVRRVLYGRAPAARASLAPTASALLPSLLPPSAPPSSAGGDQGG